MRQLVLEHDVGQVILENASNHIHERERAIASERHGPGIQHHRTKAIRGNHFNVHGDVAECSFSRKQIHQSRRFVRVVNIQRNLVIVVVINNVNLCIIQEQLCHFTCQNYPRGSQSNTRHFNFSFMCDKLSIVKRLCAWRDLNPRHTD